MMLAAISTAAATATNEPSAPQTSVRVRRCRSDRAGGGGRFVSTLSTLLICVVMLAAVIIVGMTVRSETAQTLTKSRPDDRAPRRPRRSQGPPVARPHRRDAPIGSQVTPVGIDDTTVARRIRSAILLLLLVT